VRNRKVIRPLIELKRYELIDFLNKNGIKYVSDTSNRDIKYIRNRIRHNLIPLLQTSYNPKIIDTLNRLASIVSSEEEWMEGVILLAFKKTVLSIGNNNVTLSVPRLCDEHLAVQRRIIRKAIATIKGDLRRIRFSHIDSATGLLESRSAYGNLDFPDRIRIQRSGDILMVTRQKNALRDLEVKFARAPTIAFTYKIEKPGSIFIEEIGVHLTFTEMGIKDLPDLSRVGQETAFFDWDSISFPLVLRNFQPGDRFKPLGVMGTQKVKKYFIDKKVSKAERVKCAILLSQGKIIWLVGYRIDETVKVIPSTRKVLKVELFLA
jgi:tRNA(Ile)-lysidine synthase